MCNTNCQISRLVVPGLKDMRQVLFVHVPSGKMIICGQAPPDRARRVISLIVLTRESGSSRDTSTGCVKLVNAENAFQTFIKINIL